MTSGFRETPFSPNCWAYLRHRLLRGRDQSACCGDDPTVAPTHDRINSPDPRHCVASCCSQNPIRPFENNRSAANLENRPTLNRCRSCLCDRHHRLPRGSGDVLAESIESRVPPGDAASAFAKGAPAGEPTAGGVCRTDVDAVLRAPSLLPLDLISGIRGEGGSVRTIELKAALFAPHAHPSPTPTTRALPTKIMVRVRSPPGFNNANISS